MIERERWPGTSDQWQSLFDIVHRAELTANSVRSDLDPNIVLEAIHLAAQHAALGRSPRMSRRLPRWAGFLQHDQPVDVASLASLSMALAVHATDAPMFVAPARQVSYRSGGVQDAPLTDRHPAAHAVSGERALLRLVLALLGDCPEATFGSLTVDLVRSATEAERAGTALDKCMQGGGNWRFMHSPLGGWLAAQITEAGRVISLFSIGVRQHPSGAGIVASACDVAGPENSEVPRRVHAAAKRYARLLQRGVFGLERYLAVIRAYGMALRRRA